MTALVEKFQKVVNEKPELTDVLISELHADFLSAARASLAEGFSRTPTTDEKGSQCIRDPHGAVEAWSVAQRWVPLLLKLHAMPEFGQLVADLVCGQEEKV